MLREPSSRLAETSALVLAAALLLASAGCNSRAVDDFLGGLVILVVILLAFVAVAFSIGVGVLIANIVCLVRGRPNRNLGIAGLVVGLGAVLEGTGGLSLRMSGVSGALHAVAVLLGGGLCYAGYQNVTRARR